MKEKNLITRECEICHKTFSCYPSQSKNKTVCSMKCYRERQNQNRVITTCKNCGREINLPKSLAKEQNFCSNKCLGEYKHKCFVDSKIEIKCKNCESVFMVSPNSKQKFCSEQCAKEYVFKKTYITLTCEVCGTPFITKISKKHRFCSKKCQYEAQSLGLVKSYSRGNYGYREDLGKTFRSSFEANFARVCNYLKLTWKYESQCFLTPMGHYTPDFFIEEWNCFVETRGHKKRDLTKALLASQMYNFELKVIFEEDFLKQYGYLKPLIPNWEDNRRAVKNLYNPEIYETRICKGCGKEFQVKIKSKKGKTYCSISCANKHKWKLNPVHHFRKHTKLIKICKGCGKPFECLDNSEQNYCTRQCYWRSIKK